jgi:hypothetical protein
VTSPNDATVTVATADRNGRRGHRRVVLADYKAKKIDEGAIDIELDDGTIVTVPPPQVWPDDVILAARTGDPIGPAKLLLGDKEYERFLAGGGSGSVLNAIIFDELGMSPGE